MIAYEKLCDQARDSTDEHAPKVKVLTAEDEHPALDGVVEEVRAKADEQYSDNARHSGADNSATHAAGGVANDRGTSDLKEACGDQRDDDGGEDAHGAGDQDGHDGGDHGNDKADEQSIGGTRR